MAGDIQVFNIYSDNNKSATAVPLRVRALAAQLIQLEFAARPFLLRQLVDVCDYGPTQLLEYFLHVGALLGRSLTEWQPIFISHLFALLCRDLPFDFEVYLVAYQVHFDVGLGVVFDLRRPVFYLVSVGTYVLERVTIRDGVDQHHARRPLVVRLGDRPVPLLASSVPHLKLDLLVL